MNELSDDAAAAVSGGDLDGNAGEREAREYMATQGSIPKSVEYCESLGTGTGMLWCVTVREK